MSTDDLLLRYERWMLSTGWSPRTQHQRLRRAAMILDVWSDPSTATPTEIAEWLGTKTHLKAWSRATYFNDTKAFFRWLTAADHIPTDPMESDLILRPRVTPGLPKPLSPDEEARALAAARGDVRAYLLLALRAGLRATEIATLTGEHVTRQHIRLVGKGAKEAVIPTHPELWDLADEYPREGYWFPSVYDPARPITGATVGAATKKLFARPDVNIPSGSIHRCRHTYATDLLRGGANVRQVQELMRHSSLVTTATYTAVADEELREAVGRLGHKQNRGSHLRAVR
ncbi:MAG: hypothetical protein CMH83_00210 [Nocardioides sp.]|nr:hypothetical protein [Nocardioides sp.]